MKIRERSLSATCGFAIVLTCALARSAPAQCLQFVVPVEASELDVTSSSSTGVLAVIDEDGAHFYDASGSEFFFVQESGFSGMDFDDIAMDGTHAVIGHVWDDYAALGTAYV